MKSIEVKQIEHWGKQRIGLFFDYDQHLITKVKILYRRKWSQSRKCWHIPFSDDSIQSLKSIFPEVIIAEDLIIDENKFYAKDNSKVSVIFVKVDRNDKITLDKVRAIKGQIWHSNKKLWSIPSTSENTKYVKKNGFVHHFGQIELPAKKIVKKKKPATRTIPKETLTRIEEMRQWMEQKRYSKSSIKTYISKVFWFVQLSYDEKFSKIKAKNAGIAVVLSRLFNADIRKFCSKLMDKLNRLWYMSILGINELKKRLKTLFSVFLAILDPENHGEVPCDRKIKNLMIKSKGTSKNLIHGLTEIVTTISFWIFFPFTALILNHIAKAILIRIAL